MIDSTQEIYWIGNFFKIQSYKCGTLNCLETEDSSHLFWECPFASECWNLICPQRERNLNAFESLDDLH
jgi:hypothetical protein